MNCMPQSSDFFNKVKITKTYWTTQKTEARAGITSLGEGRLYGTRSRSANYRCLVAWMLTVAMRSAPEFHQRSLSLCENYPGGSPRAAWKGQAVKQPRCPRQAKPHAHQCKSSQATVLIRLTPQYAHTPGGHCQAFLPGRLALYPGFVHTCREGPEALVCGWWNGLMERRLVH